MDSWWTWPIGAVSMLSMWLLGKPTTSLLGWAIGLGCQVLWVAYVVTTRQWGLLTPAVVTLGIMGRNLRLSWRVRHGARERVEEVAR